ncbi:MAG TPA: response regulator, partial [Niastella sp.]
MKAKILIVEDQFIEAKSLNVILTNAGYSTCSIARSVTAALSIIENEKPDLVLVDIFLQGEGTGIDLGNIL